MESKVDRIRGRNVWIGACANIQQQPKRTGGIRCEERGDATGSKIMFSLSRLFFFGITNMLGVDSCVFLIFTTRVDPNKRNKHPLKD
jgi:hypothetical protein